MSVGFGYFRFQRAMPSLQCFNMRFYGHIRTSPWPVEERASEGGSPTSRAEHPDGSLPRHHTVKDVLGYRDGTALAFDTDPDTWVAHACAVAGRDLTEDEWHDAFGDERQRPTC